MALNYFQRLKRFKKYIDDKYCKDSAHTVSEISCYVLQSDF